MSNNDKECGECTVNPEQQLREKIIRNLAELDFVHVCRCQNCTQYHETAAVGWCDRYDEPKMRQSYCSEGQVRNENEGISKPGEKVS